MSICEHCHTPFTPRRLRQPTRFCGTKCMGLAKRTLPDPQPKTCPTCKTEFTPRRKYQAQTYCGHKCEFAALRGPAFNARIARESITARADMLRGRGEGKTYRKRNGRHEHRVVAEAALGRPLRPGEVVTFKDGTRRNTSADNLAVLPSQAEHARITFKKYRSNKRANQ